MIEQSNLTKSTTLGTPKKWLLYRTVNYLEIVQTNLAFKLVGPDFCPQLLRGGNC
jgi:hypothetical protein